MGRKARAGALLGMAWVELLRGDRIGHFDGGRLLAMFQAAVECDATVAMAWVGLGVAEQIARGPEQAEARYRHALAIDSRCAEAWYYLGNLQLGSGERQAGIASLEKALCYKPDLAAAQELRARYR